MEPGKSVIALPHTNFMASFDTYTSRKTSRITVSAGTQITISYRRYSTPKKTRSDGSDDLAGARATDGIVQVILNAVPLPFLSMSMTRTMPPTA